MSKVDCFEDLKVWQKARDLCKLIHGFTLHDHFAKDYRLVGQIKASSGSIMITSQKDLKEMGIRNSHNSYLSLKGHPEKPDLSFTVQLTMDISLNQSLTWPMKKVLSAAKC